MEPETKIGIVKRPLVKETEKEEMYVLLKSYFANLKPEIFRRDMEEKDWVIILEEVWEGAKKIVGFSTIQLIETEVDGQQVVYVFSGDTIVAREYWQSNMLAPAFGFFMLRMIEEYKTVPLYWFLITKGYRTYRFLPVYFRTYYPACNRETPPRHQRLLEFICTKKFGENYNPGTGIISFDGKKDHLNDEMCIVPDSKKGNPHVAFFLRKNPFYYRGDELACIADISRENLNERAYRIMEEKKIHWVE